MRKINKLKTKLFLILSAMLSSSIILSSCSSVITNDNGNGNVEKPVPSIELKILNNKLIANENEIIENEFDLFLKNLGGGIETNLVDKTWYDNFVILNKICDVLNTMNIVKFDKDVKYTFDLVDGKEYPDFNSEFNSYKIILKIDTIEEVKSINFFGKDLVSLNNNEFLFFENVNKTRDYSVDVDDRFDNNDIKVIANEKGSDGENLITSSATLANYYRSYNSFYFLVKHLYNLGIYDIHGLYFSIHPDSKSVWRVENPACPNDNYYDIDRNVYDHKYYDVKYGKLEGLKTLLNTKYKNKSFDIIENSLSGGYKIAFKTFPWNK